MLTCVTRSMNDELYEMMLSLCPQEWNFIKVKGASATGYLEYIFETDFGTKWVLNLDEDCFLIDSDLINSLISFMENHDYDYCGIQDGGSIPVRIHNPLVSNPFFNLFNSEKINRLEKNYYDRPNDMKELVRLYSSFVRFTGSKYEYDMYEPFYNHFFWLLERGMRPLFLEAKEFRKERYFVIAPIARIVPYFNCPTMLCSHDGGELAIHTWHSRFYNYPNIRKHIRNCYEYALKNNKFNKKEVKTVNLAGKK